MEILTPIDLSAQVEQIKRLNEDLSNKLQASIGSVIPKGYTLEVDQDTTYVYKTPEGEVDQYFRGYHKSLLTRRHNGTSRMFADMPENLTVAAICTPNDIYRLCGVMQLLIVHDLSNLTKGTKIVGK